MHRFFVSPEAFERQPVVLTGAQAHQVRRVLRMRLGERAVLLAHNVPYVLGKTWTTDAFFRETAGKVQMRRAEGCLTVEMEAAAFFAVAQFRGVTFAQLLYGGDDVSSEVWDHRDYASRLTVREKLFWLAAEACLLL